MADVDGWNEATLLSPCCIKKQGLKFLGHALRSNLNLISEGTERAYDIALPGYFLL